MNEADYNRLMRYTERKGTHLIWTGSVVGDGTLQLWYGSRVVSPRRLLWMHSGRPLLPQRVLSPTCGQFYCIEPEHQVMLTRTEHKLREWTRRTRRVGRCERVR